MALKISRIKGEDRPHNILVLPLLGKIRLGVKKISQGTGKEYPAETDYFVCPPEVLASLPESQREKPVKLNVMLPVENEEMFFKQFYAVYGIDQRVKCIGNGEQAERRNEAGERVELSCPHPENCDYGKKLKCRARTIIQVVLPDVNAGGVYQISTGSISSDIDIRSGIEMARYLFGRISWVPMSLVRQEKKIMDPSTGKMQTHWPVKLFPVATVDEVNNIRQDTNRIIKHQEILKLPEPIIDGPQDDTPYEIEYEGEIAKPEQKEAVEPSVEDKKKTNDAKIKEMRNKIVTLKKMLPPEEYTAIRAEFPDEAKFTVKDWIMLTGKLDKLASDLGLVQ